MRKVYAADSETDPFKHGRIPAPFIWGIYDGETFEHFLNTEDFIDRIKDEKCYVYAHNGGKFDFMYLLDHLSVGKIKIINGRIAEMKIGKAVLRDSFSIIPTALAAYQKEEIDYVKFEESVRWAHMLEITEYLRSDCVNLFKLVSHFRENAGTGLTIAGNALGFARKQGLNVGRTTKYFDSIFREFYYGGRCQALQGGSFKGVALFDLKSAYPFAMIHDHPSGRMFVEFDNLESLSDDDISRSFISLRCHSFGAFPKRGKYSLDFPIGEDEFKVTGWEYLVAKKHGLIKDEEIISVSTFDETISFEKYVNHWFEYKDTADARGDKVARHIGKIMLNSLYGKLCQNPEKYTDYKVVDLHTKPTDGWELALEYETKELHWRPSLYTVIDKYGEEWQMKPKFYNVATGASITGFCRAMIVDAIATVGYENALYCDTDSIFVKKEHAHKLQQGTELGDWGSEGIADEIHIGGKKLYAARSKDWEKDKMASKGSKLTFNEIKRVVNGEVVRWFNDAPTFKIDGSAQFIYRNIRRTA